MSFSRWSNSVWYTYSDVYGGFTVCGEKNFTDKELENIDECLKFFDGSDYTPEEIDELRGYMEQYINSDQTDKYKCPTTQYLIKPTAQDEGE